MNTLARYSSCHDAACAGLRRGDLRFGGGMLRLLLDRLPRAVPRPSAGRRRRRLGAQFRALRPFVRSGEDFVLIQELVDRQATVDSQEEFDRAWQRPGTPSRKAFKDLFYQARSSLMDRDRQAWLAMNPIYPHVGVSHLPTRTRRAVLHPFHQETAVRAGHSRGKRDPRAAGSGPVQRRGTEAFDDRKAASIMGRLPGDLRGRPDRRHPGKHQPAYPGVPRIVGIRAGELEGGNPVWLTPEDFAKLLADLE